MYKAHASAVRISLQGLHWLAYSGGSAKLKPIIIPRLVGDEAKHHNTRQEG